MKRQRTLQVLTNYNVEEWNLNSKIVVLEFFCLGKQTIGSGIVKCFSIRENFRKLTHVSSERELMIMHVFKIVCIYSLGLLHHIVLTIYFRTYDLEEFEQVC